MSYCDIYQFSSVKNKKIFTGLTYKLLLSLTTISELYRSVIPNKNPNLLSTASFSAFESSPGNLQSTEKGSTKQMLQVCRAE